MFFNNSVNEAQTFAVLMCDVDEALCVDAEGVMCTQYTNESLYEKGCCYDFEREFEVIWSSI